MASQVGGKGAMGSIAVLCVQVFGIRFFLKCLQKTADGLEMTA